jgi:SAM-dependent methyltransferase
VQQQNGIDHGKAFDWGRASADYAKYRDIYPPAFFQPLLDLGLCGAGQEVLDLGTGTGALPRALAVHGARFTGTDLSPEQIAQARSLSAEQGLDITYQVCPAEELDFPSGAFDAATACQCFWYFDRARLLPKLHEMLKPGGRLCLLNLMWTPKNSEIARRSEALVLRYNPHWTGRGYRPRPRLETLRVSRWGRPQFSLERRFSFRLDVPFSRESWHGRIRACRGIGASSLPEEEIAAWERDHLAYLQTVPEIFEIPHHAMIWILRRNANR